MYYLPRSGILNAFNAITIISNVPSIVVLVLVPYLLADLAHPLLSSGAVFMIYRIGNITGSFLGPKLASSRKPHYLASIYEVLNAVFSIFFLICLMAGVGSLPTYSVLYFFKGVIGGLHNNTRFQWLKALSLETQCASKVLVYCGAIIQAAFGLGGLLLLLAPAKNDDFFVIIFSADVMTSIIAVFLFLGLKSRSLPELGPAKTVSIIKVLTRPEIASLGIADLFIGLAVAGTNILILKFGIAAFSADSGYPKALIIYSLAFVIGSYIVNELGTKKFPLILQVICFSLACLGMWILPAPFNAAAYFIFFGLYPLLLLGFEKAWFENLDQELAGTIHARRIMTLSFIWAVGETIYAGLSNDLMVRFFFLLAGILILVIMNQMKKKV